METSLTNSESRNTMSQNEDERLLANEVAKKPAQSDCSRGHNSCDRNVPTSHEQQSNFSTILNDFDRTIGNINIRHYIHENANSLRFPELLLLLLVQAEREISPGGARSAQEMACIAWTLDGKAIVIRDREELFKTILPIAHCKSKLFSSFTRKLYRWGFRRLRLGVETKNEIIFFHPLFNRDDKPLITRMRSVSAEGVKRRAGAMRANASPLYLESPGPLDRQRDVPKSPAPTNIHSPSLSLVATCNQRSERLHSDIIAMRQNALANLQRDRVMSLLASQHRSHSAIAPDPLLCPTVGPLLPSLPLATYNFQQASTQPVQDLLRTDLHAQETLTLLQVLRFASEGRLSSQEIMLLQLAFRRMF